MCNGDLNLIRSGQFKMKNLDVIMDWEVLKTLSNKEVFNMTQSGLKEWEDPTLEQKEFFRVTHD